MDRFVQFAFASTAQALEQASLSTKSTTGHLSAAAGVVEAIVWVRTIRDGVIHPTINYEYPDPECDLDYVPNQSRKAEVKTALRNSFGLGGHNACLVLKQFS